MEPTQPTAAALVSRQPSNKQRWLTGKRGSCTCRDFQALHERWLPTAALGAAGSPAGCHLHSAHTLCPPPAGWATQLHAQSAAHSPSTSTPRTPAAPSMAQRQWNTSDSRKRAREAGSAAAAGRGGSGVGGVSSACITNARALSRVGDRSGGWGRWQRRDMRAAAAASLTKAQGVEAVAGGQVLQVGGGVAAREPAGRVRGAGCIVGVFSRAAAANPGPGAPPPAPRTSCRPWPAPSRCCGGRGGPRGCWSARRRWRRRRWRPWLLGRGESMLGGQSNRAGTAGAGGGAGYSGPAWRMGVRVRRDSGQLGSPGCGGSIRAAPTPRRRLGVDLGPCKPASRSSSHHVSRLRQDRLLHGPLPAEHLRGAPLGEGGALQARQGAGPAGAPTPPPPCRRLTPPLPLPAGRPPLRGGRRCRPPALVRVGCAAAAAPPTGPACRHERLTVAQVHARPPASLNNRCARPLVCRFPGNKEAVPDYLDGSLVGGASGAS